MSTAKMLADSTQSDIPDMSSTKKRKKIIQKKKLKKRKDKVLEKKSRKRVAEDDFDEHDLELDKIIHPLGFYVKDRENLLEQMFHCVRGQSLQRALPDILKELPLEDLKRRCLEQLEVMSKKRIRRLLAGDNPATISSSGTDDDTSEDLQKGDEDSKLELNAADSQVVDSTSQYTHISGASDRELEHEEGSLGNASVSASPSGGEQLYEEQEEEHLTEDDAVDNDIGNIVVEGDTLPSLNTETVEDIVKTVTSNEFEEAEEGEVTDEHAELEETTVALLQTEVSENNAKTGQKTDDVPNVQLNVNVQKADADMEDMRNNVEENNIKESVDVIDNDDASDNDKEECVQEDSDSERENIFDVYDEVNTNQVPRRIVKPPKAAIAPALTRNQMELLELEMRARAIKAMLKMAK